jgi:hypothetical protein
MSLSRAPRVTLPVSCLLPLLAVCGCGDTLWGFGPVQDAVLLIGAVSTGRFAALGVVTSSRESCESEHYEDDATSGLGSSLCEALSLRIASVGRADGFSLESPVREVLTFHSGLYATPDELWGETIESVYLTPCYGDEGPDAVSAEAQFATVTLPRDPGEVLEVTLEFEGDYEGSLEFFRCP